MKANSQPVERLDLGPVERPAKLSWGETLSPMLSPHDVKPSSPRQTPWRQTRPAQGKAQQRVTGRNTWRDKA